MYFCLHLQAKQMVDENDRARLARFLRESRGRDSQRTIAKKMGLSPTTIQNWESGASFPTLESLEFIADFFDVPLSKVVAYFKNEASTAENRIFEKAEELLPSVKTLSSQEQKKLIKLMLDSLISD